LATIAVFPNRCREQQFRFERGSYRYLFGAFGQIQTYHDAIRVIASGITALADVRILLTSLFTPRQQPDGFCGTAEFLPMCQRLLRIRIVFYIVPIHKRPKRGIALGAFYHQ
jgi:hypothetical protein